MPSLTSLDLSFNELTDVSGITDVPSIKTLNLNANKSLESIKNISPLASLETLTMFESGLKDIKDVAALLPFNKLKYLNLNSTPMEAEAGDAKMEAHMILLRKFFWCKGTGEEEEKEEITEDDLAQAHETLKERERQRLEEEENERLRREEEEANKLVESGYKPDPDQDD